MDNINKGYTLEDEMWIERSWGKFSTTRIAKKLNRSETAIKVKAYKMGLGSMLDNKDYLIGTDIIEMLGISRKTFQKYISRDNLPMKEKKLTKTKTVLSIEYEEFITWLEDNINVWDGNKVDRTSLELLGYDKFKLEEKIKNDKSKLEKRTLSDKDIEKIIKYHKQCYKYREIADLIGKDYQSVKWKIHTLIEKGILEMNNKEGRLLRNIKRENYGWTENQDSILIKLFREGKTLREISDSVGKSLSATKSRNQLLTKRMMNGLSV